jgi:SecD/SecF fusion protein
MGSRRRNLLILLFVVGLTAASAIVITQRPTVLGLDLSGGTQLVYEARPTPQVPEPGPADIERAIEIIRERTDALGVSEPEIAQVGARGIEVNLPNVQNAERAIAQVGTTAQLYLYDFQRNLVDRNPDLSEDQQGFARLYDAVTFASERKPDTTCEDCSTDKPKYYLFDDNTLELEAGPAERRADLFFETGDGEQPPDTEVVTVPPGTVVLQDQAPPDNPETDVNEAETAPRDWVVLKDQPELTGDQIVNPEQNFDPTTNAPNVTFEFTDEGREAFQTVTARLAQRAQASVPPELASEICTNPNDADQYSQHFAISLDQEIVSRPIINFCENPTGIDGRNGAQISGIGNVTEAQDLARFLQIGALPVNLTLISQSTVSATLGQEALDQGLQAGIAGLIVVLLFLLAYYRALGLVAGLGLLVYAVFFFALIKLIPITMTLPGIAGLILTLGVAADSNVVIFERIKEEARAGKSMASAIATGYRKGIATIIDANVITLITAFILFVLATAGVKGFAFTLGIGTIVSLFTAVLFTQAILGTFGRARFLRSPQALGAGDQKVRWNFDFTGTSRWFFSFSGAILAIGAIAFATNQLNLGIDFESGTRITASLEEPADPEQVRTALLDAGVDGAEQAEVTEAESVEGSEFGTNVVQISAKIPPNLVGTAQEALEDEFGLEGGDQGFDSTSIGPTFGAQVARSAVIAIIFSLIVISAYVAIRFEAKYAVPVLIALVHDILITGGVYALVGAEVSSATVAAFLTVLGYSMYDCVIVFDRVRENVPRMPRAAFSQIVNRSMSEILTRSLITGLSAVFLVGMLLVFGGETLGDFALAMMIGIFSGTYSSIFIAAPVLTEWKEREPAYRSRRRRIQEAMGFVPTFPEDNLVAKIDEAERHPAGAPAAQPQAPAPAAELPAAEEPPAPAAASDGGDGADGTPQPAEEPPVAAEAAASDRAERAERKAERQRRRQRRRRKHGRNR